MAYLRLYDPTTDSCDFKVKLSNDFNRNHYRRLRITSTNYGSSTSNVSRYVESITARNSSSRYVRGEINEGMSAGRTYTLYAYAQAQNGTWYRAGSDTITMKKHGGSTGGHTGGSSSGHYDSRVGVLSNFDVDDESSSAISFDCNALDPFDYLKVYLNGSFHAKLIRGQKYGNKNGDDYRLRGDGWYFEYVIDGLSSNTNYEVKVVGYRNNGDYGKTYRGSARTKPAAPRVGKPTNPKYRVHKDGLGMTITFTPGSNSTKTIIKNGSREIITVTGHSAELRFGTYKTEHTLYLIGANGSTKSAPTALPVRTGDKPGPAKEGLKEGDTGDLVRGMQELLYYLGYLKSKKQINSTFGPNTKEAVVAYQEAVGLHPDGIIDNTTRGRLASSARFNYEAQGTREPEVQVAPTKFSQKEKRKSMKYEDIAYRRENALLAKYEQVGWGVGINLDYVVNTGAAMVIYYDKEKIGPKAITALEAECKKEKHVLDWNKPFVYGAGGFSFAHNIFSKVIEAGDRCLHNINKFKFKKQVPSGSAVIVKVMKLKTHKKFNPEEIVDVGWCIGGTFGYFTANASKTDGAKVLVICSGASTPGIGVSTSTTHTAPIKKYHSDKWF